MSERKNTIDQCVSPRNNFGEPELPPKLAMWRVSPENSPGGQELLQRSAVPRVSPENSPGEHELPCDLPENIRKLIEGKPYKTDDIGMSGSKIFVFDDCVLKIVEVWDKAIRDKNDATVRVMRWLEGKIPVPKVLCYECTYSADRGENSYNGEAFCARGTGRGVGSNTGGETAGVRRNTGCDAGGGQNVGGSFQYLLMSRVPGKMSCDTYYLERPRELVRLLASALKMLWSIDVQGCPRNRTIEKELEEARFRVENTLVDVSDSEPDTFGKDGFASPTALLHWLQEHKPDYEPVLSHGDFCLPNVFVEGGRISGFIDLGETGIGDKWREIALCYRSLKHNFDGTYGGKVYPDFKPDMLFEELGIEPDREKIRYYILLDELF